jgi:Uma2 family endonuclease
MARPPAIETEQGIWLALNIESLNLTDDQILRLCSDNGDNFQFEIDAQKRLIIMSPCNPETSRQNAKFVQRLANWTELDGTGICFGPDAGFRLPNGALRAPDASWIPKHRWNSFSREQRSKLLGMCPDFVVELRSPSDPLAAIREKMQEYMANGARLGWLLDPIDNRATVYKPSQVPEDINHPTILSGDPILPGFKFDFRELFDKPEE